MPNEVFLHWIAPTTGLTKLFYLFLGKNFEVAAINSAIQLLNERSNRKGKLSLFTMIAAANVSFKNNNRERSNVIQLQRKAVRLMSALKLNTGFFFVTINSDVIFI